MTLGKEEPMQAKGTDLKRAIAIGLDECTTALEEAFYDLTDEQFWAFPLDSRHNIVTLAMHALENLDEYGLRCQGGQSAVGPEQRFDVWSHSPAELHALEGEV